MSAAVEITGKAFCRNKFNSSHVDIGGKTSLVQRFCRERGEPLGKGLACLDGNLVVAFLLNRQLIRGRSGEFRCKHHLTGTPVRRFVVCNGYRNCHRAVSGSGIERYPIRSGGCPGAIGINLHGLGLRADCLKGEGGRPEPHHRGLGRGIVSISVAIVIGFLFVAGEKHCN